MPRVSIDYMNARRESYGHKGKTIFIADTNLVDQKAQRRDMDALERAHIDIIRMFSEFRSHEANRLPVESIMRGESFDDLSF